ncbi:MAG: hypothetical protein AB2A00_33220, partial [Myxococcota bacterium]
MAAAADQDGDGVPDPDDDCPARAGPAPTGCPKDDRDGDGLWDGVDSCPGEAEDINGLQDGDGCPDDPDLVELEGAVRARAPYVFPKGRSAPPRDVQNLAKAVARWMKGDPRAQQVEVVVVLDPAEKKDAKTLAQDRAAAVAVILGAAGVRSEKIITRVEKPARKGGPPPRTLLVRILLGTAERAKVEAEDGGAAPRGVDGAAAQGLVDGGVVTSAKADAGKPVAATGAAKADAGRPTTAGAAKADAGPAVTTSAKADAGRPAPVTTTVDAGKPAPATHADAGKPVSTTGKTDAGPPPEKAPPPAAKADAGPATSGKKPPQSVDAG